MGLQHGLFGNRLFRFFKRSRGGDGEGETTNTSVQREEMSSCKLDPACRLKAYPLSVPLTRGGDGTEVWGLLIVFEDGRAGVLQLRGGKV